MRVKKRLSLLLCMCMVLSLLPAGVFAAEPDATIAANAEKDLRYLALDDENNGPNDLYYQQKVMNPVTEEAFVLWYSGKNTGYAISWTSSDPELIAINDRTHMAELKRIPDEDAEVTLMASMAVPYSRNSAETYEMTKELTVLVPCAATRLRMDADALTITNMQDVRWAVEQGITKGTAPDRFSPNDPCTRAHVATFLWRAMGGPAAPDAECFSDCSDAAYYAEAVRWAVSEGITKGTGPGRFSPNDPCTRGQIVTFLYRAFG